MNQFTSLFDIKHAVADARDNAIRQVRKDCGFRGVIASRGTFLSTADATGQCEPRPEAECPTWDGTKRDIDDLIALVVKEYPNVDRIYIGGGYDWASSPQAYRDGDYEPWAASWGVIVWRRDQD